MVRSRKVPRARLHRTLRPHATTAARTRRRPRRRVLRPAPDSPRQARPARHRRLDDRTAARRRAARPDRGHRGPGRTRLDPHRQSVARHRLARRHRRRQPGRRHLRPPAPRRTPHRVAGPIAATDAPRPKDPHAGDNMSIPRRPAPPQRGQTRSRAPPVPPGPAYGSRRRHGKRARDARGSMHRRRGAFPTPPWTAQNAAHTLHRQDRCTL